MSRGGFVHVPLCIISKFYAQAHLQWGAAWGCIFSLFEYLVDAKVCERLPRSLDAEESMLPCYILNADFAHGENVEKRRTLK